MDLSIRLVYTDGTNTTRYALKVDSVTVNLQKTPIQIPIPQNTPQLVDFGIFRPSITVSAIVDSVGANKDTSFPVAYKGMDKVTIAGVDFFVPYKNMLEQNLYEWIADDDNNLTLIIGDATYPVYNIDTDGDTANGTNWATGGGEYEVALQKARFQMDAGREDRWICQMQFVSMSRRDVIKSVFGGS